MIVYTFLEVCKTKLDEITDFKTNKIGLELGINSKDTPYARTMPLGHKPNGNNTGLRFQVLFGLDIKNKDYEELHKEQSILEDLIIEKIQETGAMWLETVYDEDSVRSFKSAIVIFEIEGICV